MAPTKFLRMKDVQLRTGLARSSIYYLIGIDAFPKQIKLTPGITVWMESEVEAWIAEKVERHADEQ